MAPAQMAADRLRLALEMFALGESMMRERLRREHPTAPPEQIDELLGRWLSTRPGAETGDAPGRPRPVKKSA